MIYNKILGYTLLVVGLFLISWPLFHSYQIFNGKASAPALFKMPAPEAKTAVKTPSTIEGQLQQQMDSSIKEQLAKMLPPDTLPRALNLFSWSILAGISIFGGGQIAVVGIRTIN